MTRNELTKLMPILILGGSQFIGRATVSALLQAELGELTLLTSGRTRLPFDAASVRHVRCDRKDYERVARRALTLEERWCACQTLTAQL